MKNIVLVAMNNVSLLASMNNNTIEYGTVVANNSKLALLTNLKTILTKVPSNDDLTAETRQVIIGSKSPIIGLITGTWRQYIKTGKNAKGAEIPADELALWKDIANLYVQKCFNVQFTSDQYINKNDRETKELINKAWELVKEEVRKANNMTQANKPAQPQAQANPVIAKLQELMAKALDEGDFDTYDKLEERLNKLQPKAPVVEETQDDVLGNTDEMEFE
jgi:hypothetical protein